jgi:spore coat protein U-like protein
MQSLVFLTIIASIFIPTQVVQACVDYYIEAPRFSYQTELMSPTMGVTTINITKFTCPKPVYLRVSAGSSSSYQKRYMNNGNSRLEYNFYVQPNSASAVWGDGSGGTHVQQISGATTINLYTIIAPQQDINPGQYTDSTNIQFSP